MEGNEFDMPEVNLEELGIEKNDYSNEDDDQNDDDQGVNLDENDDIDNSDEDIEDVVDEIHVPVYNWMKDTGYFFNESEDDLKQIPKTPEEFFSRIEKRDKEYANQSQQAIREQITNKVPSYLQKVVDAAIKSPDPIPEDTFMELINVAKESQIKDSDFENGEFAENFLREDYKDKGIDEETVDDIIAALKDKDLINKTAKNVYSKSNKGNEIIDKFVNTIDKKVEDVETLNRQFEEQTIEAFKGTGWREDKIKQRQQQYSNGEVLKRLQSMLDNPAAQPYLADFAMFWDGKKVHLDKYAKQAVAAKTKDIEDKINKKSNKYFKTRSKSSNKSNDPLEKLDLNNLQLVTK